MWLYTSYAVQPHGSVASKNGDLRYHGPKYKVLEVSSGIALTSPLTAHLPSAGVPAPHGPRTPARCSSLPAPPTESLFNSIRRARGTRVCGFLTLAQHPVRRAYQPVRWRYSLMRGRLPTGTPERAGRGRAS